MARSHSRSGALVRAAFAGALALGALACDRRLEPFVAPEDEPPALDRPVRVPGLETPAARPTMPMGPPAQPRADGGEPPAGAKIRGVVIAGEGVAATETGVLFVIARSGAGGPPLAVKRLAAGPFPLEFEIGPADAMIQGRPFAGPIQLSARIDADGDPLTRTPDDPIAELASSVQPGQTGVELRLARGAAP